MMLTEIERQINLIEDSRELDAVYGFVKDRRRALGNRLKYILSVGDRVAISSKGKVEEGTVTKINRTRAIVSIDHTTSHGTYARNWSVPFTSMKVKEKGEINA